MIRSKKTKIKSTSDNGTIVSKNKQDNMRFMAYIKNYKCLFCQKTLYIKNFENAKCSNCSSQWFEKLADKKAKTVQAI